MAILENVYALESATESARSTKGLKVIIIMKLNYSAVADCPAASCSVPGVLGALVPKKTVSA